MMKEPATPSGGFSHVQPSQLGGGFTRSDHDTMFTNAFSNVSPATTLVSMPSTSAYTLDRGVAGAEPQRRSPTRKHEVHRQQQRQQQQQDQEQQQEEEDETLTPEEARRLKRKEQNKMAQRRHREKQRNQMNNASQVRPQRQSSNGDGSPTGSDSGDASATAAAFSGKQSAQASTSTLPDGLSNSFLSRTGHMGGESSARNIDPQSSFPPEQHQYLYQHGQGPSREEHMHEQHMSRRSTDRDEDISPIQVPNDQFDYSQLLINDSGRREHRHGQPPPSSSLDKTTTTRMHGLQLPRAAPLHDLSTIRPSDLHSGEMPDLFGSEDDAEPNSAASHDSHFGFQHLQNDGQGSSAGPDTHGFFHPSQAEAQAADLGAGTNRLNISDTYHQGKEHELGTSDSQGFKKRKHKGPGLAMGENGHGAHGTTVSRPMSNAELLKYFASLTSLQMPWADQLLSPRWDLIKVLELASARLGLMFEYVEDDRSISFLANDFLSATRGLGRGPASSGPGQTELGKWPTEEDPDVRVPIGESLLTAAAMASAAAMGSSDGGKGGGGATEGGGGGGGGETGSSASAGPVLRWSHVPHNMRPSRLSGCVGHHPYIDLSFPWPVFRDRVLAAMSCHLLHEIDLCMEIWPGEDLQPVGAEPPYWIHGDDPFDPESYEVSDRFAKRYPWLLDAEIIRRTNWWRRQQSKPELPLMVTQVSRSFAPFFEQQIEHLTNPDRVPPPGQLPQALNHLGIGSMIPPLNQLFGVNAQANFLQQQQQQQGGGGEASITSMDDVMTGGGDDGRVG